MMLTHEQRCLLNTAVAIARTGDDALSLSAKNLIVSAYLADYPADDTCDLTRQELIAEAERLKRFLDVCGETLESIQIFCKQGESEFAVQESLNAISHNEWLKEHPEILTNTELLLEMAEENERLKSLDRRYQKGHLDKDLDTLESMLSEPHR